MRDWICGFFMAWGMFLAIPCPRKIWSESARQKMLVCMPLVGLLAGGVWAGAWLLLQGAPGPVRAAVCAAAAPAVPVHDTIKLARDRRVTETPDRSMLFAVQTPQVFDAGLLKAALQSALTEHAALTDDCSAVERLGKAVYLTDGDEENIKITTPLDLIVAETILRRREEREAEE